MKLVQTCPAMPEQYDVFGSDGVQVGYLRLRHGYFAAYLDGPAGELVYSAATIGDGAFDHSERHEQLSAAVAAIAARRYTVE